MHYLFYLEKPKVKRVSEIIITHENLWLDDVTGSFQSHVRRLRRVRIRDEGRLNNIKIVYEQQLPIGFVTKEIYIPISKGKLKEAIEVEERLMKNDC